VDLSSAERRFDVQTSKRLDENKEEGGNFVPAFFFCIWVYGNVLTIKQNRLASGPT
jgi:hypothetical protein